MGANVSYSDSHSKLQLGCLCNTSPNGDACVLCGTGLVGRLVERLKAGFCDVLAAVYIFAKV